MINSIESYLKEKMRGQLPGMVAHAQMTENIRAREMMKKGKAPRKAGVLILIYLHNEQFHIPMIMRPIYEGVHSGQMAFPGGRHELEDQDLITTALRETHEEVGVKIKREAVVGKLTDLYIPPSNSLVTPVVGITKDRPSFIPDPREVAAIHEFPLRAFADKNNHKEVSITISETYKIKTPSFVINNNVIWGASAMIINELLHLLKEFQLD